MKLTSDDGEGAQIETSKEKKKFKIDRKRIRDKFMKKNVDRIDGDFIEKLVDAFRGILKCDSDYPLDRDLTFQLYCKNGKQWDLTIARVKKNRKYYRKMYGLPDE
mmetsp:Transcript_12844/g.10986  ORF Transcript_12844/g.10986 Transcript_12844/m.10986 type:complete len:105 (+) Transcript_12844:703-1017(+)|eukprot:CAMPEP_0114592522 /NCGR_PEP_ID=MMETSP0125-20121206/14328_1 /TAXON_ID=485358 ORGANISM="Aristerostoma sp., Strain ATCC 50986" /NCGR_SAMPLE_ID=MMETSP0125 /ASSEMBLY_ACC=CAM_ASM_000245 /LENGTH=104 /DNA_ID=CAMNT_0001791209 /DNA_START=698 /DNA_END=1012 /DNA_ORIENTATION=-